MPRLTLNGEQQVSWTGPAHWGELLDTLDREAARRNEVVAAVRFDGVEEPAFREAGRQNLALASLESIEVETSSPQELIEDALKQGSDATVQLAAAAAEIAVAFRDGRVADANRRLTEFTESMSSLMALSSVVASALGFALDQADSDGSRLVRTGEFVSRIEAIIDAHQSHDWLTVADMLQYDIQPALEAWRPAFESIRSAVAARTS